MSDHPELDKDTAIRERDLRSARLVGFSLRDRELLRLFLRRPPRAGVSLTVVEDDDAAADLLIANTATAEASEALRAWGNAHPAIGIVDRFDRDAGYYQIAQDGQMLFSLAQAINRIRAGWTPPLPAPTPAYDNGANGYSDTDQLAPSALEIREQTAQHLAIDAAHSHDTSVFTAGLTDVRVQGSGDAVPLEASLALGLAAVAPTLVTAPPPVKGLPWQRALDILVIDDSHFSREAISAALVKVGFSVNTSESGADGLKLAREKRFDVALVDFEMPGMQGPEVLRKLRALGSKAPSLLIMLTSRTGTVDRLRAKFAGCDAYLTKPTQMKEFLKILRDFAVAGKLSRP